MTRINIGILAKELCDQHVASELREIPRVFTYSVRHFNKRSEWPVCPTLNTGHLKWAANYQNYCYSRLLKLRDEAEIRGMTGWYKFAVKVICNIRMVKILSPTLKEKLSTGPVLSIDKEMFGRELLKERIIEQIQKFKNPAKWSYPRNPPEWAVSAIQI